MFPRTGSPAPLDELDMALVEIRRFWQRPGLRRRFLAELGEPVELSLLRTLRAIETLKHDEACVGDVATALGVDSSTASRLVDHATKFGYILRRVPERDRRRSILVLSSDGVDLLERATKVRQAILREMTAGWSNAEIATLATLLRRLRSGLDRLEPQG